MVFGTLSPSFRLHRTASPMASPVRLRIRLVRHKSIAEHHTMLPENLKIFREECDTASATSRCGQNACLGTQLHFAITRMPRCRAMKDGIVPGINTRCCVCE